MTKKIDVKDKPLSKQEQIFLQEWEKDFNCCRAAVAAGYSIGTARTRAGQWVSNGPKNDKPWLTAAINKKMAERALQSAISVERIEAEIALIAFAEISNKNIKVKDKIAALELLGKRRGMFRENIEISGAPLAAMGVAIYIPSNRRDDEQGN